jgi:hypothetical protein
LLVESGVGEGVGGAKYARIFSSTVAIADE